MFKASKLHNVMNLASNMMLLRTFSRCKQRINFQGAQRLAFGTMTREMLPEHVKNTQYAVRGAVVARSAELQARMDAGEKLPFDKLIPCNIGNPQAVGQKAITFPRQVETQI